MNRRHFARLAGGLPALLAMPAARSARTYRIYAITWRGKTQVEKGLEDHFGKRGLAVDFTWRDAGQNPARFDEFAQEIAAQPPDLLYTWGTPPTLAMAGRHDAKPGAGGKAPARVPLLFAVVADPVGAGIVPSLDQPGRDVTGVSHVAPLSAQLEVMRSYRRFTRLGLLYNAAEPNSRSTTEGLRKLARAQRIDLVEQVFERDAAGKAIPDLIEDKVAALKAAGCEWLYLGPDSYLASQIARVAAAAMRERLPTFSATEGALNNPAPVLTGLVSSYYTLGQFAGYKAEQILAGGRRARDIPIETLARYSFIVRMDVAKQLDVLPPVALFNYAVMR